MAAFSLLLAILETYTFYTYLEPARSSITFDDIDFRSETSKNLPNIYHIILDAYQTDFFSMTLTPDVSSALAGFVHFPNTIAIYNSTGMSLSSIFTGKKFKRDVATVNYKLRTYSSEESFLYALKKGGYTNIAYVPSGFARPVFFDHHFAHLRNTRPEKLIDLNTATFQRLWLYANAPRLLTRWLMGVEWFIQYGDMGDLRLMRNERFLSYSRPVASYLSFLNILEQEPYLPESGRYTFVHIYIPHPPDLLNSDCSYGKPNMKSGPFEQAQCATKLMLDFLARLKSLDRFDNSLNIVHGDHGNYWRFSDGIAVPS